MPTLEHGQEVVSVKTRNDRSQRGLSISFAKISCRFRQALTTILTQIFQAVRCELLYPRTNNTVAMSYTNSNRAPIDDDDVEEEALVADYQEQVTYEDGDGSYAPQASMSGPTDIKAQLEAAAAPLEYSASLEVKFASYDNYCSLFHYILNSDGPVDIEQPSYYWAWDVIDEFIYQFESFCRYRNRVARTAPAEEEAQVLKENPNTWGCYSVLNVLYSLIQRSQINEQLAAQKRGEDPATVAGEYGSRPLYKMLGYFSIIGLLRVHCLLGDFSLALKTLDDIEMNKKAMFARVMAAHLNTYY